MTAGQEKILIAPCGIYCGGCPLFQAHSDAELRRKMAAARGIPESELVLCAGCRPLQGKVPVSGEVVCATYACIAARGLEFCYECAEFPCLKLAPCADRAADIPHNTKIYNLLLIEKEGPETFAKNYKTRVRNYMKGKKPKPGGDIEI